MDIFAVDHSGFDDHNSAMSNYVNEMGTIIGDLNGTLSRIPDAYGGQAAPVWEQDQLSWDRAYRSAETTLNSLKDNHVKVADIFMGGDNMGARIMGQ